jgi:hypothetical protein
VFGGGTLSFDAISGTKYADGKNRWEDERFHVTPRVDRVGYCGIFLRWNPDAKPLPFRCGEPRLLRRFQEVHTARGANPEERHGLLDSTDHSA